jgi:hypothetical protein
MIAEIYSNKSLIISSAEAIRISTIATIEMGGTIDFL